MADGVTITRGAGKASLALKLPTGDLGTDCTILAMRAVAEHAAESDGIRNFAAKLKAAPPNKTLGLRLYEFIRDHRKYKDDPAGVEYIRDPERVLAAMLAGKRPGIDCDDAATLAVSVLLAAQYAPAAFVVIAKAPYPARFRHVFYATHQEKAPSAYKWPDGYLPKAFQPWDPQEAKRVPAGKMAKAARVRVYPC